MSICGYNDKIGQGLQILVEGMIEALEKKAAVTSVSQVLDREIIELDTMITTMRKDGDTLPEMFVGLNILAKALFERVRHNLTESGSDDLAGECRAVAGAFNELLSDAEKRNEEQDHRNAPAEKAARQLAEWVLQQCVSGRLEKVPSS
ncbi:MAG: hypothetical protein EPO07_18075 [Verrucomicrobia bacterium]|nr:MAG: hypothetical protein EPO07_18075 [Verrucomicrobiota bacterium]